MMRSLYSGVSGLKGHQTKMDVVGNNIANVNTTGFKSSRVTFADTLSQTQSNAAAPGTNIGGINPKQIGLGVGVASIDTIFTDGSIQATGKNTDVAISGNALFIVKKGSETYYTRDGAFEFDGDGNYVLPGSGLFVQGWMGEKGVVDTKGTVSNIKIPAGTTMDPTQSTIATYSHNLNSDELTVKGIKLNDDNGNSITVDSTSTTHYSIGGSYTSTITSEAVTFSNGLVLSSANGSYAMNGSYPLTGNVSVTLSNTDVMTVPAGSSFTYMVGNSIPTSGNAITSFSAGNVIFADGATLTNNSGSTYTVTLGKGDTITVPSTNTTSTFAKGSPINENVESVTGTQVTLVSTSVLTNNSGRTYTATLNNGDTFTIPSTGTYSANASSTYNDPYNGATITSVTGNVTSFNNLPDLTINSTQTYTSSLGNGDTLTITPSAATASYTANGAFPSTVTVTNVSGSTVTLSDGSTINITGSNTYTVGQSVSTTLGAITGYNSSTISTITGLPTDNVTDIAPAASTTISQIDGTIVSADGTTDSFSTTSSSVGITPNGRLTVSGLALTDDNGATINVKSADTNAYKVGDSYSSKISSMIVTMSDGTDVTKNSGTFTLGYSLPLTTTLTVYDTLGNAHNVVVYFTKTKTDSTNGNQWTASLNLDGSGKYEIKEKDGSTTTLTMPDTILQFDTMGKYVDGAGNLQLTLSNGAKDSFGSQTVTVDLTQLTQFAGGNTISGACDGNAMGTLKSVAITSSGVITGTYTNGITQSEAQIAFAQFNNAAGLTKTGNSLYQTSRNSGNNGAEAEPMAADDLGISLTPSALEMSNVDIANEFSDMIITQRGFQSNSKIITVSDEMLETMINMKR